MKKLLTTLFIITVLITGGIYSSFAQEATSTEVWTAQEGAGSSSWYSITSSADGTKLIATKGASATDRLMYISNDSGDTWAPILSTGAKYWQDITMSSDGEKIAVFGRDILGSSDSYIYTSIDGGNTWNRSDNGPVFSGAPGSIFSSSDADTLVAVQGYEYIYISHDWGETWATTSTEDYWDAVAVSSDGTKLFAGLGGGRIYISENGGQNWSTSTSPESYYWVFIDSSENGQKVVAATNLGYEVPGFIYVSEDGGETWATSTSAGERLWESVQISADGGKFVAIARTATSSYDNHIYISIDGGDTWATSTESLGAIRWSDVALSADGSKLAAVESGGYIYTNSPLLPPTSLLSSIAEVSSTSLEFNFSINKSHSKRGVEYCSTGISSTPCNSFTEYVEEVGSFSSGSATLSAMDLIPKTYYHYRFYSENEAGRKYSDIYTTLLEYREWDEFGIPLGTYGTTGYTSLSFSSDGSRILATGSGYVRISRDGGESWHELFNEIGGGTWLFSSISSDGMKMVVYRYGGLYISQDGGITWSQQEGFNMYGRSLASFADGEGLITAYYDHVYISVDSGATWATSTDEGDFEYVASSADGLKLATADSYGYIHTSTDGGVTWTERAFTGKKGYAAIASSADGMKLIAAEAGGYSGYLYISDNGGESWRVVEGLTNDSWSFVSSSADGKVLAAISDENSHSGGYIYTSNDGGNTWTKNLSAGYRSWSGLSVSADGTTIFAGHTNDFYYYQNLFPEAQDVSVSRSLE